jgi:hypothetical protein
LRCESHIGSINERPVAETTFIAGFHSGPEGPRCQPRANVP